MTVSLLMHSSSERKPGVDRRARHSVFNRLGPYLPTMIVLSLAVPTLIYILFMKSMGWNLPLFGINGAFSYASPAGSSVVLYASSNTKTYFTGIGGNYEVLLGPWRNYFVNRKLEYKEIQTAAQLRRHKDGVLILPSSVSLSDEEKVEILAFRSNGGAILATWATGTRNGSGEWQGWQFLESLGAKVLGEIPATADATNLVLTGESPVSHTQVAGQRIELRKTAETFLRSKGDMVAARFMNWSRVIDDERRGEGAVVFSEMSEKLGRVTFFAFAESAWEAHTQGTYDLIDDTLQWLRREPVIVRAAWPYGKHAAQVIEMDTEEGFVNALPFASLMQSINYRSTFYVLTSVARLFPEIVAKLLARDFELGYHGDVHTSFKDQPGAIQEQRMQAMRDDMTAVIPDVKLMTGFRAPTEGYDLTTEKLLPKFGIRHHTADPNRTDGRLPLLLKSEGALGDALVVLPRTQRDDINLYSEKLTVNQTTKALIDDFDLVLDTGALGLLSVHSQNFMPDSVMAAAMPGFLEHLKERRGQLWMASAGQVADWWRDRDRLKMSMTSSGNRIDFNITVTGTQPLSGATLIVMLPQKGLHTTVEGVKIGMVKPAVLKIDEYREAIVYDSLTPGSYVYQATFSSK